MHVQLIRKQSRTYTGRGNGTYTRGGSFSSGTKCTPVFLRGESQNETLLQLKDDQVCQTRRSFCLPATNSTPTHTII
jgi:hypothetical protein